VAYFHDSVINIGTLKLYSFQQPVFLVLHDLLAISAFFSMVYLSRYLSFSSFMVLIGQNSMLIYLTHSFLFYCFYFLIHQFQMQYTLFLAYSSFLFTVILSYIIAVFITKNKILKKLIIPRDMNELKTLFPGNGR